MKDINFLMTMINMRLNRYIIGNKNLREDIKEILINDIYDDLERILEKVKNYKDIADKQE